MKSNEFNIGQRIEASFWVYTTSGDDLTTVVGTIVLLNVHLKKVLVDVDLKESFNPPSAKVWVSIEKSSIKLLN